MCAQDAGRLKVGDNAWVQDPWPPKRQRIAYVQSRGPGCFDTNYYQRQNEDLKVLTEPLALWDHFVTMGQFEGRSFRHAPLHGAAVHQRCLQPG